MAKEGVSVTSRISTGPARSTTISMGRTTPFGFTGGVGRGDSMFRPSQSPFGKDMAVVARPKSPLIEPIRRTHIMQRRHPGLLVKPQERYGRKMQENPFSLPKLTPDMSKVSQDRLIPVHKFNFSEWKVVARPPIISHTPMKDSQKLDAVRGELRRISETSRKPKIDVMPNTPSPITTRIDYTLSAKHRVNHLLRNAKLFRAVERPARHVAMHPESVKTNVINRDTFRSLHDFTSSGKENIKGHVSEVRRNTLIRLQEDGLSSVSQRLARLSLAIQVRESKARTINYRYQAVLNTKNNIVKEISAQTTQASAPIIAPVAHLEHYTRLMKELEKKKGTSFMQAMARTLPVAEFISSARSLLTEEKYIIQNSRENNKTQNYAQLKAVDKSMQTNIRVTAREQVKQAEIQTHAQRMRTKSELPIFEEDPSANEARLQYASQAAEEAFKDAKDKPISGRSISRRMPRILLPIEVLSELMQRLKLKHDGSYHELHNKISQSGVIPTIKDAVLIIKQAIFEATAVRRREIVSTRAVSEKQVDLVLEKKSIPHLIGEAVLDML